jgi:tetratricopeptide (TPR) repeat protein
LLEKALEVADKNGYEAGAGAAHSELGRLLTILGKFKQAQEHLELALRSDTGSASQRRLNVDNRRLGLLWMRSGKWAEAEQLVDQSYQSSRDIGNLENRLAAQLVRASLRRLRGQYDDAYDQALDATEAARSAGFVRRHVHACWRWRTSPTTAGRRAKHSSSCARPKRCTAAWPPRAISCCRFTCSRDAATITSAKPPRPSTG